MFWVKRGGKVDNVIKSGESLSALRLVNPMTPMIRRARTCKTTILVRR
jgi:hypothetical protein